MKHILLSIFIFLALLGGSFETLSQPFNCSNIVIGSGGGNNINIEGANGLGRFCAPVTVNWFMSFKATIPPGANVDIIVDWDDGEFSTYDAILSGTDWIIANGNGDDFGTTPVFQGINNAKHIYENETDGVCFYEVSARLVIDGNICNASRILGNTLVNYWDIDEVNPGNVAIEPLEFLVCAGDQVTLNFDDATEFNCINSADTDIPNGEDQRNVRWTYNTTDGPAPAGRIDDVLLGNGVTLDGSNAADQNYIAPTGNPSNTEIYPAVVNPGDAVSTTLDITVPASATVGEVFEVKLENWGPCNPLGGSKPAIERYAIIRIVAPPQNPNFTISSDANGNNLKSVFCPGEDMRFRGTASNHNGNFIYRWEVYDGPTDAGAPIWTRNNDRNTWLSDGNTNLNDVFSGPGFKLVRMYVRNSDTNFQGNCEVFIDKQIEIVSSPVATIQFDAGAGIENGGLYEICLEDIGSSLDISLYDQSTLKNVSSTTTWIIEKTVPGPTVLIDLRNGPIGASLFDYPANPLSITEAGEYRVRLRIEDGSTNCTSTDQLIIRVYDTPSAAFNSNQVCEGSNDPNNKTLFSSIANNLNGISPRVNGDEIDRWMWDFSYDAASGFNIEADFVNNNDFSRFLDGTNGAEPSASVAGTYTVALVVESAFGCTDTLIQNVTVKLNPDADIEATYTNDYLTNNAGDSYTGAAICPGTFLSFTNTSDASINSDPELATVSYELEIEDFSGNISTQPIGAPGSASETIETDAFNNLTGSNQNYKVRIVATGANSCEVISPEINVLVLPAVQANFDIFDGIPGDAGTSLYNSGAVYCSPYEFYFETDQDTEDFNADQYLWTVTDAGTGTVLDTRTVNISSDANPQQYSYNFTNTSSSTRAFDINLDVITNNFCVSARSKRIELEPQPIGDFTLEQTVVSCSPDPIVQLRFEAQQTGLGAYNWSIPVGFADTVSTVGGTGTDFFVVTFNRPPNGAGDLNYSIQLITETLAGCPSVPISYNGTIEETEIININASFTPAAADVCLPAIFDFENTTTTFPSTAKWSFEISRFVSGSYVLEETLNGTNFPGNEDFTSPIQYEFTQPGQYRIDLVAVAESNCVFYLATPSEITIRDRPQVRFRTNVNQGCSPLSNINLQGTSVNLSGNASSFDMYYEVINPNTGVIFTSNIFSGNGNQLNGVTVDTILTNPTTANIDFEIKVYAFNPAFPSCINDSSVFVRVFPEPQIDFAVTSTNPACEADYSFDFEVLGTSIYPAGTTFRWNFGDGSTVISPSLTQTKTYSNPNGTGGPFTYTVELIAQTPDGCTSSISHDVTLLPLVRPGFFLLNIAGCTPFEVEIRGNAQGTGITNNIVYEKRLLGSSTWTPFTNAATGSGDVIETFTNTTGAPGSDQVYEIRQIVTGNGPCSATSPIQTVTIYPEPVLPTIVGPQIVCENEQNVEYAILHRPNYTYQWEVPASAFIASRSPNNDTILVSYGPTPANPNPQIAVTVTDANQCKGAKVTLPVNIVSGPTASLSLTGPTSICPGETTDITVSLNGPGTDATIGYDVVIYNGFTDTTLLNIQDGFVFQPSPTQSSNFSIRSVVDLEYPSCPGRPSPADVRVNVNNAPTASISGDATICNGETTNIRVVLTGQAPWTVEYTDDGGVTTKFVNSSSSVFSIPVSPTQNTSYQLVGVVDNICTGTVGPEVVSIDVNQLPTGNIFTADLNPQVCVGSEIALFVQLTGFGPWSITYNDGTNSYSINNIQLQHDPTIPGANTIFPFTDIPTNASTTYTLTEVIDSRGCRNVSPSSVTVNLFPVPQARMTTTGGLNSVSICEGESVPLNFNFPSGAAPFDIQIAVNDFDTLKLDDVANPGSITIDTLAENTTFRIVSLVDNNGCTTTDLGLPVRINVRERPTAVLSGVDSICYGEETNLTFNFTGKGPWTVTYNNGIKDTTFTTPFNRHFELVSPEVTTEYTLVSVTDSNSPTCSGPVSGTANIEVAAELIASFTATPENMILPDRTITITNTTTNKEEWDYLWQFGDSTTSTAVDPGTHVYDTYGTYFLTMTATSKNGKCSDNFQTIIEIDAIPAIVDFDATPRVGCLPLTVQFENLTQFADSTTYLWDFGDNQSTRVINPQHTYTRPGTYRVRLSANNITGVPVEKVEEQFITVYETPEAIFNVKRGFEQVFTEERVEFSNSSNNADQFLWNFGDGNESNEFEPVHMYADSGIYDITLVAINSSTGCADTLRKRSQVMVLTDGEFKVPNAFTPSRGGQGSGSDNPQDNDFFRPIVNGAQQYNLKIFNRWGELLFESNDKEVGWDGYYKGELMPMGVYVFRLEIIYENGRREVKLGDVTLVR
ncbi:hypothetical protein GCM10011506_32550 [Marivirga lumbricoides]|uniref:PKD domain-containing protein n=1 Tax=Marivirga lumbricoides TaxID=1046115 RepID=A0ABQ1MPW5_9BACT|nr:hypothetical protein GCM10011506_32550 [Marivirga lumbricoides]